MQSSRRLRHFSCFLGRTMLHYTRKSICTGVEFMLKDVLKERDLLPILKHEDGSEVTPETWQKRRTEMLKALETYSYGITPKIPVSVRGEIVKENARAYASKAFEQKIEITITTEEHGDYTFPVWMFLPKHVKNPPVLLHLAFRFGQPLADPPVRRVPVEEILDHGYALVSMPYGEVMNDRLDGTISGNLADYFGVNEKNRKPDTWGKIGMWSYGASRVMDYLQTRDDIDREHIAVIGHSRLGKASLWAGAQDERFWCTISNDSGYGGAATSKGIAEDSEHSWHFGENYNRNWTWCCDNFMNYTDKEDQKPYDQSWLLACCAPRLLYVGSAVEDRWADPAGEFVATVWAAKAWEMLGKTGLITADRMPEAGEVSGEGNVGYHMRFGTHFLSREDWNNYIAFLDRHLGRK